MHRYRKKTIYFLLGYLIIFLLIFIWGMYNIYKGTKVFSVIGLSADIINWIVVIASILAIIKVVWELFRIETKYEFETRVKVY